MASKIIKFPDERVNEVKIITALHEANGTDYMIFDSNKIDNNNKVVGVSYKTSGEERFHNIIDMEAWKKAKALMVANIKGEKEGYDYLALNNEILVTEDYKRDLALREDNLKNLEKNYEMFLNSMNNTQNEITRTPGEIISFPNQSNTGIMPDQVISNPENTPLPSVNPIVEPVIAFQPEAKEMPTTTEVQQPIIEPVVATPVINEAPVTNNIFAPVSESVNNNVTIENQTSSNSSVAKYYENTMNSFNNELKSITDEYKNITDKYKELTDKIQTTAVEISGKMINLFKEIDMTKDFYNQNVEKSQQILASQNNDNFARDLTKAA